MNDDGDIVAVRWKDWKVVYKENRGKAFGVWREPFTEVRVPLLFNLRRDPYERAQHNANVYEDWALDRVFILFGANKLRCAIYWHHEGLSAQSDAGIFQPRFREEAGRGDVAHGELTNAFGRPMPRHCRWRGASIPMHT